MRNRPKWLRIILGLLSAWISFFVLLNVFFILAWLIQIKILDILISGTPAMIILIIELIASLFFSYRITKWQNRYLENKSLKTNYITVTILILLSILLVPASINYSI